MGRKIRKYKYNNHSLAMHEISSGKKRPEYRHNISISPLLLTSPWGLNTGIDVITWKNSSCIYAFLYREVWGKMGPMRNRTKMGCWVKMRGGRKKSSHSIWFTQQMASMCQWEFALNEKGALRLLKYLNKNCAVFGVNFPAPFQQ